MYRLCFVCPVSNLRSFSTNISFTGWHYQPHAQPPSWRTRVSLLVWIITFDLSGVWYHTSGITTASIALRIIWPRKPHHYVKIGIPSVGCNSCKNVSILKNIQNKTLHYVPLHHSLKNTTFCTQRLQLEFFWQILNYSHSTSHIEPMLATFTNIVFYQRESSVTVVTLSSMAVTV